MLEANVGYNISPEDWFTTYDSIGKNGTFITDQQAIADVLGDFKLGPQKSNILTILTIYKLEKSLGLRRGSLKDGYRITEVYDITFKNPRLPTSADGNKYFKFGQGLPGGGPEIIIDSIPTGR